MYRKVETVSFQVLNSEKIPVHNVYHMALYSLYQVVGKEHVAGQQLLTFGTVRGVLHRLYMPSSP